jgi:CRP/FNR family transcriptional regulator
MTPYVLSSGLGTEADDALAYLPVSPVTEYSKGQIIFGPSALSKNLHLVVSGKVGISRMTEGAAEVLLEIVVPDDLFGESAFLGVAQPSEVATALERVSLMAWDISEIEDLVLKHPRLGIALLQILARRTVDCNQRIESLSADTIERRLARSLIRFSERLGVPEENGSTRMMPFTHEMLARYVGTSRELITQHMNRFRSQGWIRYSRKGIVLYSEALQSVLVRRNLASAAGSA